MSNLSKVVQIGDGVHAILHDNHWVSLVGRANGFMIHPDVMEKLVVEWLKTLPPEHMYALVRHVYAVDET